MPDATTPRPVTFRAPDGFTLEALEYGEPGRRAAVLCHMHGGTRDDWAPLAEKLAARGYLALAINHRGYGASEGPHEPSETDRDVSGAVEYLRSRGADQVYAIGASMGGSASLIASASVSPPFAGVVAVSAPDDWAGLHVNAVAPNIRVPVLLIGARDDPDGLAPAKRMHAQVPGSELMELEGPLHGTELWGGPDRGAVEQRIIAFLDAH